MLKTKLIWLLRYRCLNASRMLTSRPLKGKSGSSRLLDSPTLPEIVEGSNPNTHHSHLSAYCGSLFSIFPPVSPSLKSYFSHLSWRFYKFGFIKLDEARWVIEYFKGHENR